MRNSSSLDWLRFMHTPNDYRVSLEKDWEAVQAAIDIPFSNGLLEGTVNKIKAVKRQMYNRAGSKLLRAKILYSQ